MRNNSGRKSIVLAEITTPLSWKMSFRWASPQRPHATPADEKNKMEERRPSTRRVKK